MKIKNLIYAASLLAITSCGSGAVSTPNYTQYVDTYIGTGGHGHVFMGASVPFGAVQLGPTSILESWDWVSGYHISDTTVIGFAHTHLNGTGIGDLSDVSFMPVVGDVTYARGNHDDQNSGLWSYFSRENEVTRPGYYATRLDRYGIDVELATTERVGMHRYKFPASTESAVVIDMENGTCWDEPVESYLTKLSDTKVAGYRYSKGWADAQRIYFVAEFSRPFTSFELIDSLQAVEGDEHRGKHLYGRLGFDTSSDAEVMARVAISPVSIENAELNLAAESKDWDLEAMAASADQKWNEALSKIDISTQDESVKHIFYTALYHSMIAPSLFCDVNGDYRGADGEIYSSPGHNTYTTFSLWDTYRAAHPLMSIIHPEKMSDMINTMLNIYDQQGKLPVWHLVGCETDCMVGNPGISVVADALLKGYEGFDHQHALEAMINSAMLDERGMNLLKEYGYIPCDLYNESVANSMEYAIADWSVGQAAKKMGDDKNFEYFNSRSHAYRKYFDPESRFIRGLKADGKTFSSPFNPFASSHRADDYCEGNAWQYTFLAPHDLDGLVDLFGGKEQFITKLDSLFTVPSALEGEASPDISGLIGQYAHGNEPSHHILYFYTMLGQPYKGADKIREVLTTLYHDAPDGLAGNEDVGQMSSWYILSSMGIYQVEPAGGRYFFGSPLVDSAVLKVKGGEFKIIAHNNSATNRYIQSVKLNGEEYAKNYIDFADIAAGGELVFEMGDAQTVWY